MYKVQLITLALLLLFSAKLASADPIPGPMPDIWDNIDGTAGEALSPFDFYLAKEHKLRVSAQLDPISTNDFYDSTGALIRDSIGNYYRVNLPITFEYGIPGLFEVGFRVPYIVRSGGGYWVSSNGWGDISVRLRRKIYGEENDKVYLALGGGIKFPTSIFYFDYFGGHQALSQGSLDFFLGAYSVFKTGVIKYPIAITFSHTGRSRYEDQIGEIITYRADLITELDSFTNLSIGLKGYEIIEENSGKTTTWYYTLDPAQGISKTSIEADLVFTTLENRVNFSAGIAYDLRGKRSYAGTSPIFSMQVNF